MATILKLAIRNIYPNYQHNTDLIFPVYKIDREQSWTFGDTKEVFRSHSLWELSKGLNIFLRQRPTLLCISYHSVMKLPGSEPDFVLSKITRPRWLELPIARTDFDSPFKFEPAKFYCTIFKRGGNSTLFLLYRTMPITN
jgi:hypothetical protein